MSEIRDVQNKILETMKYIDTICKMNGISYFIMGGTALGAVRHGGFIPWDDDLDIFMIPDQYEKFKSAFNSLHDNRFVLQEWRTTPDFLEYTKVRMNGTTFIEHDFADRKDMHHGIYVDIMILHKVPHNKLLQKIAYYESKYVTLYALSQRNWKPKNWFQLSVLMILKFLPNKRLIKFCYRQIYKYDTLTENFCWCYWITPAKFKKGLFSEKYFIDSVEIPFEDTKLLCSRYIKEYLSTRYGDYMRLPSKELQAAAVHAEISDTEKDYRYYLNNN